MNLLWDSFELVAITLAVLIARFVAEDGESTWYEGAQLLTAYGVVAVAFYLHE
jgi:Ca2+:H+ antiporter